MQCGGYPGCWEYGWFGLGTHVSVLGKALVFGFWANDVLSFVCCSNEKGHFNVCYDFHFYKAMSVSMFNFVFYFLLQLMLFRQ